MPLKYVSPAGFRSAVERGEKVDKLAVAAPSVVDVEAAKGERVLRFAISSPLPDRHGDVINQAGWLLESYKRNAQVLWNHDPNILPLAHARNVRVDGGKLKADAVWTPEGFRTFNDDVFKMYQMGYLKAVSVGFRPLKWKWREDADSRGGIHYIENELLEFSCVAIPAAPECLIEQSLLDRAAVAPDDSPEVRALTEKVAAVLKSASRPRLTAAAATVAKLRAEVGASVGSVTLREHDPLGPRLLFLKLAKKALASGNSALAGRALDAARRLRCGL